MNKGDDHDGDGVCDGCPRCSGPEGTIDVGCGVLILLMVALFIAYAVFELVWRELR